MKIIGIVNNIVRVGKTKIIQLLVEYFSGFLNKKILVIDLDPRYIFSSLYLDKKIIHEIQNNIINKKRFIDEPYITHIKNLHILIGNLNHFFIDPLIKKSEVIKKLHLQLNQIIKKANIGRKYDLVLIDSDIENLLTYSIIKTATHIIIPIIMDTGITQNIYGLLQLWLQENLSRDINNPLYLIGLLPNMVKLNTLNSDMLNNLKNNNLINKFLMPVNIKYRKIFSNNNTSTEESLLTFKKNIRAKKEAMKVCEYINKKIFNE